MRGIATFLGLCWGALWLSSQIHQVTDWGAISIVVSGTTVWGVWETGRHFATRWRFRHR